MRKAEATCVLALAGTLVSGTGAAQQAQPQSPGRYKSQPLNLHRERLGTESLAETARARVRDGNCAGALEAFDAAIRSSTDPTLLRDRGSCQESLGHPYPAIDDFRAYLTALPEAPDSDAIRVRLVKLEHDTMGYSSASTDLPGDVEGGAKASASVRGASAQHSVSAASPDRLDYFERDEDPLQTPLRRGKGWSFAPFFSEHKWGVNPARLALIPSSSGSSFDDTGTWAECVGLEFRYSVGPSGAVVFAAGYEHFNSTGVDLAVISGLTSHLAYEWRFPLDAEYVNQLILAPGIGYEHLVIQPGDAQSATVAVGGFVPRLRFGWRHLLASSAGVDLSLDGGAANFFQYANFPFDSSTGGATTFFVALNIAMVWEL